MLGHICAPTLRLTLLILLITSASGTSAPETAVTSLSWTQHGEENCSQLHSTTTSLIISSEDVCSNSTVPPHLTAPAKQQPGGSSKGAVGGSGTSASAARGSGPGGRQLPTEEIIRLTNEFLTLQRGGGRLRGADRQEPGFSCRGANGNRVEWWIALKQKGSFDYVFVTSEGANNGWQTGGDIRYNGPVFETLQQAKGRMGDVRAFYSYTSFDSTPTEGHQNGFVLFSKTGGGFWLIHSFRRLHEYFFSKGFPDPGRTKGQSFICTSHPWNHLNSILNQLTITKPRFVYPNANPLGAAGNATKDVANFSDIGGKTFVHFANPAGGDDLYNWIAIHYNTSLLVQSWENPRQNGTTVGWQIPRQYIHVTDVEKTSLLRWSEMSRSSKTDHSKWCIADLRQYPDDEAKYLVCIGDLNRPQNRSGGAMCMSDRRVWHLFRDVVRSFTNRNGDSDSTRHPPRPR